MDFMDLIVQYVVEQALIIALALWVIGALLKRSQVPDKFIVWVLLVIGIALAIATLGLSVEAVIQGILVTGLAVYGHQLLKQAKKKE